jgi:hypothetical protein
MKYIDETTKELREVSVDELSKLVLDMLNKGSKDPYEISSALVEAINNADYVFTMEDTSLNEDKLKLNFDIEYNVTHNTSVIVITDEDGQVCGFFSNKSPNVKESSKKEEIVTYPVKAKEISKLLNCTISDGDNIAIRINNKYQDSKYIIKPEIVNNEK